MLSNKGVTGYLKHKGEWKINFKSKVDIGFVYIKDKEIVISHNTKIDVSL